MVLDKTCPGSLRFFHTCWEVSSLCAEATKLKDLAVICIAQHHLACQLEAELRDDYVLACVALAEHIQIQASLPRVGNMELPIPVRPARPEDFGQQKFSSLFHFRRGYFMEWLRELEFVDHWGEYKEFLLPKRMRIRADSALLVLLRHLSYPERIAYIADELGMSCTRASYTWTFMVDLFYSRWSERLGSLATWEADFEHFAQLLEDEGCCHSNVVGFLDSNFMPIALPGGEVNNLHSTMDQQDVYSGYYKGHSVKHISLVLPNGIHVVYPWAFHSNESYSMLLADTHFIEFLRDYEQRSGKRYALFGDAIFATTCYFHTMLKAPQKFSPEGDLYNKCMALLRVGIENEYGTLTQHWKYLSWKRELRAGSMQVGKFFSVASLVENCRTILHGNHVQAFYSYRGQQELTLSRYLAC